MLCWGIWQSEGEWLCGCMRDACVDEWTRRRAHFLRERARARLGADESLFPKRALD